MTANLKNYYKLKQRYGDLINVSKSQFVLDFNNYSFSRRFFQGIEISRTLIMVNTWNNKKHKIKLF